MTQWEEKRLAEAGNDIPRFYALDITSDYGYSVYGSILYDYDMYDTLTEDNGRIKVSLLRCNNAEQDGITPLPCGSFFRMANYGYLNANNQTIWEYDADGQPKNFKNYYITSGKSRWFELPFDGRPERYKHTYEASEIIECLKDYPIRSTKTFAEGIYTYRRCLEIAFELAFRPRSLGSYRIVIKDNKALDVPNSKLEYTNATLLDVVYEIGRIIDMVPSMELNYINGVYEFELYFTDRYGLEGNITDISFFQAGTSDTMNYDRDNSAGSSISNVENMLTGETMYPGNGIAVAPNETNEGNDWSIFKLPYAIDSVEEIRIYWEYEVLRAPEENNNNRVTIFTINKTYTPLCDGLQKDVLYGDLLNRSPIILTHENPAILFGETNVTNTAFEYWSERKVFLREYEEYKFLPVSGSYTDPCKDNTVYYTRGGQEINLIGIFNKGIKWYSQRIVSSGSGGGSVGYRYVPSVLSNNPNSEFNRPFKVSVKYRAMLNGVIKGVNSKPTDVTVFFNQQAQVVDIQSFGTSVNNYTKSMNGENRIVVHQFIGQSLMRHHYEALPKLGSSVVDAKRKKRYVITDYSLTRKTNSLDLICTLTESRAGKSRYIMADNSQTIYAIPNNNVVDSKSHTHIVCKLGAWRFNQESSNAVSTPYLFNGFLGLPHSGDKLPSSVDLNIQTSEGNKLFNTSVFNSRIRLSALMNFRMMTNSIAEIKNGKPILYTDEKGQLWNVNFLYKTDTENIVAFLQTIWKDAYERFNHTTQVSWVECGNIRIHENFIDMSYFGNGEGINETLSLVLLSSRMSLNEDITEHTATRYAVTAKNNGECFTFIPISPPTLFPEHVGWAIVRGNRVLILDNFDKLKDNECKVFYNIEVRI